jgi:hypothetical protein
MTAVAAATITGAHTAVASEIGSGCPLINEELTSASFSALTLNEGELITLSVFPAPSNVFEAPEGSAGTIRLDSVEVSTAPIPGIVQYVVPATGEYDLTWSGAESEVIGWLWSCGLAPVVPTVIPTTVPILDQLLAFGRLDTNVPCPTGWGESWHPWAVPVTGGPVCTRTIPSLGMQGTHSPQGPLTRF